MAEPELDCDNFIRLEIHHAKSFNDICKDNNITTIKQALTCKEIWSLDNGISLCYSCHKNLEKLRTKMKTPYLPIIHI